jgi:single-strand selective monofunctional uracil DNA glycosylase
LAGLKYRGRALKPTKADNRTELIAAARKLSAQVERLRFKPPVAHIYNPLTYAWRVHEEYLRRFGPGRKRVVFLGMNPGPFGMAQIGIPFGEIAAARDWMGIRMQIAKPVKEHLRRPILGFDSPRSEVSGRRFWKLCADRFGAPERFFADHFVVNYCPLAFLEASGLNRTPNRLPASERGRLFKICDEHLHRVLEILQPEWLIGIGSFARERGELVAAGLNLRLGQILHPSPASPKANRGDWAQTATNELIQLGVWK